MREVTAMREVMAIRAVMADACGDGHA